MPTNEFLPFATGDGANVESNADWLADVRRLTGMQEGPADSASCNKAWRQGAFTSAMIGQFTADWQPDNVHDDGDLPTYEAQFLAALRKAIIPETLLFEGNDVGTANAIHVTALTPELASLTAGKILLIKKSNVANSTNVVATVLDAVNIPVRWGDGSELAANTWDANASGLVYYTGDEFQLLSFIGPSVITALGEGEGIRVALGLISLYIHGLTEEDDLNDADEFPFWQIEEEGGLPADHNRKTTWGNMIAKILARIPPSTPYVQYPGMGTGVGQQIMQYIDVPNNSTPDSYGLTPGLQTSAANLVAGNVQALGQPLDPYQVPTNNTAIPNIDGLGAAGGFWSSWPGLTGTWRLDGYCQLPAYTPGYGYAFVLVWRRVL